MSQLLTGQDLIDAGYPSGPMIEDMLEAAADYEARGIEDSAYLLKLLRRDFPIPPPRTGMRDDPAPFAEAIEPTSPLEEKNVGAVRRAMRELLRVPVIQRGAVMPDACPAGPAPATIPVGGAIAVEKAIIPAAHSADICCSMYASVFETDCDIDTQLDALMASTRFGAGGRREEDRVHHSVLEEPVWDNPFLKDLKPYAEMHLADQGDGNHFAYLGEMTVGATFTDRLRATGHEAIADALLPVDEDAAPAPRRYQVLVTHHGSRGLGARVYKRGQQAAEKLTHRIAEGIPKSAAWIEADSDTGRDYWDALQYVGRWTRANHESIHARFHDRIAVAPRTAFGNEHNFVWKRGDLFLHGKGATPAWTKEDGHPLLGLIPLNMAEPILVVLGRDNADYLSFAPHGAGRNQSRRATLKPFRGKDGSLDEQAVAKSIAEHTREIAVRWFYGKADLTETPIAYKSAPVVKEQIDRFGLAEVIAEIEPRGCIMAGDPGPRPWQREKELTPKQKRQMEHRADRRKLRQKLGNWESEDEAPETP